MKKNNQISEHSTEIMKKEKENRILSAKQFNSFKETIGERLAKVIDEEMQNAVNISVEIGMREAKKILLQKVKYQETKIATHITFKETDDGFLITIKEAS
jgi:hypothetical protein